MKLLIVSTAPFIYRGRDVYAYGPYVNELLVWNKNATTIGFCCPVWESDRGLLISKVPFEIGKHFKLIDLNGVTLKGKIQSFFRSFYNIIILFKAYYWADHIHIRCPGNIGLLSCFVQIFFPSKPKSAKYAGNWDPESNQPWSYCLQKWILSNTFLTRNMQVLVYGEWPNQSKNIKPFFTASYSEKEKLPLQPLNMSGTINFIFVGSLVVGKNPLYAIKLVEQFFKNNHNVRLNIYGDGVLKAELEKYIEENYLEKHVFLHGNQNQEVIKKAYQNSHFVILPSKSEGWPKAIAEGMFWGCVPIATPVSFVPFMLDYGKRGVLLEMDFTSDYNQLKMFLRNETLYQEMRNEGANWSRSYTTDLFQTEIKSILIN
ncbi:glycosyltransferase [Flavobacterium degerlachei]|jgi:glycosyltransferase involved in cell wall biosynthesis|uniref:Glycosyltransferase involved in cell wall bisynthesis n=1 Tax=Flavobacterium degerlachei TaxID=229203 RepID=A0A1H2VX33_9FLAO|nr:glycosyltransferase [Flavobacterium degerlachei]SDW72938.1 Glycosyltransferase involved in cell wall bisynthesis [Flavobacterium degerlachei]